MKRVVSSDRAIKTVRYPEGGPVDIHVSYNWNTVDDQDSPSIRHDIVDSAIEQLVHKVHLGLAQSDPIRIVVEHSRASHGNHGPLTEMMYVKVSVDGQGPSMVIAY